MIEQSQAGQSIEKILRVPGKYRRFDTSVAHADRIYAVKGALLTLLLDLGLPHVIRGDNLYFDDQDLSNLCMDLKLPGVQWRFMRLWPRFLDLARKDAGKAYEFTVRTTCPRPGHAGPCEYRFNDEFEKNITKLQRSERSFEFRGSPISEDYDFGASIDQIIAEASRLEFHALPTELADDMKFLNDTGLANCQSANRWLSNVAARYGIEARPAVGLFVSVPFSVMHVWLEIRVGDEWKHADPFFLNALARWGIVQPDDWPLSRSPRSVVFHMARGEVASQPLVWHQHDWGHPDSIGTRAVSS
jgi:hypothetical protein